MHILYSKMDDLSWNWAQIDATVTGGSTGQIGLKNGAHSELPSDPNSRQYMADLGWFFPVGRKQVVETHRNHSQMYAGGVLEGPVTLHPHHRYLGLTRYAFASLRHGKAAPMYRKTIQMKLAENSLSRGPLKASISVLKLNLCNTHGLDQLVVLQWNKSSLSRVLPVQWSLKKNLISIVV
jgi:hypothetical protein